MCDCGEEMERRRADRRKGSGGAGGGFDDSTGGGSRKADGKGVTGRGAVSQGGRGPDSQGGRGPNSQDVRGGGKRDAGGGGNQDAGGGGYKDAGGGGKPVGGKPGGGKPGGDGGKPGGRGRARPKNSEFWTNIIGGMTMLMGIFTIIYNTCDLGTLWRQKVSGIWSGVLDSMCHDYIKDPRGGLRINDCRRKFDDAAQETNLVEGDNCQATIIIELEDED